MPPKTTGRREKIRWTHPSVARLLKEGDPIEIITHRARALAMRAMDEGWRGPPFDPLLLAQQMRIETVARDEVRDARILPAGRGFRIEFNPNRPRARQRYSIAHEIAHTLFDDCAEQVRYRENAAPGDAWQLEMLCNLAAAELLMPFGSLPQLEVLDIDILLELRQRFDVSVEALLMRAVQTSSRPVGMFTATPRNAADLSAGYRIDYSVASASSVMPSLRGRVVTSASVVAECTAVGHTSKGSEPWGDDGQPIRIECVGLPPYPGHMFPRVAGLVALAGDESAGGVTYLKGDATRPRGQGRRVIVHLVNDATANWGGSFARQLRERYPLAQEDFRAWVAEDRRHLRLGNVRCAMVDDSVHIASVIGQRSYGPSPTPRVRYQAIHEGLSKLSVHLQEFKSVSLHMPRIGSGEAGGQWPIVEDIVRTTLCSSGYTVRVYDRATSRGQRSAQDSLSFGSEAN